MAFGDWDPVRTFPPGVVRPVPVDPSGRDGPTKRQAAGPRWRRSSRGLYVPATVDGTLPEQRVLEQSMRLPPGGAVTGWGSLLYHGAAYFDGFEPGTREPAGVLLAVGEAGHLGGDRRTMSREPLAPEEVVWRHDVPVTVVQRALFDEMRRLPGLRPAVLAADMTFAAGLTSVARARTYHARRTRWRRSRRAGRALGLASDRSRSPGETRMRLVWVLDARLPLPLVNQDVFDREGRFVATVDLLDPVAGLVGEYDGVGHLGTARRSRDLRREEALRRLGLEYVDAVAPDVRPAGRAVLAGRLRSAWDRARERPAHRRRWSIEPPPGWPRDEGIEAVLLRREFTEAHLEAAGERWPS